MYLKWSKTLFKALLLFLFFQQFAQLLDRRLQELNSDYEAKRYKNITLQPLELIKARQGLFNDWMKLRGKLGGQNKVPRLSNTREHMEQLLKLNA